MMKIDQTYIDEEVLKPIMKKLADLEEHIEKVEHKVNLVQITGNYNQKRIDEIKSIVDKEIKVKR